LTVRPDQVILGFELSESMPPHKLSMGHCLMQIPKVIDGIHADAVNALIVIPFQEPHGDVIVTFTI
jgi:hypothetical protein